MRRLFFYCLFFLFLTLALLSDAFSQEKNRSNEKRPLFMEPLIIEGTRNHPAIIVVPKANLLALEDPPPIDNETAIMDIYVNETDRGQFFFLITNEGDVLFPIDDLLKIGFEKIPPGGEKDEEGNISFKSLSPTLSFSLDMDTLALHISADPTFLKKQSLDLKKITPKAEIHLSNNTAFLNYNISYETDDKGQKKMLTVPMTARANLGGLHIQTGLNYKRNSGNSSLSRGSSGFMFKDSKNMKSYYLGDFSASSKVLGGRGKFGGLTFSSDYTSDIDLISTPSQHFSTTLQTPSEIEIYINDRFVTRNKFSAGPVNILNIHSAVGKGNLDVLIKDSLGHLKKIAIPFSLSRRLLRPRFHIFKYQLGFEKKSTPKNDIFFNIKEYKGDPALMAFHRLGITNYLTAEIGFETNKSNSSMGLSTNFIMGQTGEGSFIISIGKEEEKIGFAGQLSTSLRFGKYFGTSLSILSNSRHYSNISTSAVSDKSKVSADFGVSIHMLKMGELSGNVSRNIMHEEQDSKTLSVNYTATLSKNIRVSIGMNQEKTDTFLYSFFASLSFHFKNFNTSGNHSESKGSIGQSVSLGGSVPGAKGMSWSLQSNRSRSKIDNELGWSQGQTGTIQYTTEFANYFTYINRDDEGHDLYNFNVDGSVGYVEKKLFFRRSVSTSSIIVKVADIEGVEVFGGGKYQKTNKNGEVILTNLLPYTPTIIRINPYDIPMDYSVSGTVKTVSTDYFSGGRVEFDVIKTRSFSGHLFLSEKGVKKPAEFAGFDVFVDKDMIEGVVASEGEFLFENLPIGKYLARVTWQGKECDFELNLPDGDEMEIDLGDIVCEIH